MAWRDTLQKASFRGVSFKVESTDRSGGRRIVEYEYPLRDTPSTEDLGRKKKTFSIEAYVLGEDYNVDRDALIDALEQKGSGELIHPFYGAVQVVCTQFSVKESNKEGGIAHFSMSFSESGEDRFPTSESDTKAELLEASANAKAAASAGFLEKFSVTGMPQFGVDSASNGLKDISAKMNKNLKFIKSNSEDIATLAYSIRKLDTQAENLVRNPANLVTNLQESMDLLGSTTVDPKAGFSAYKDLFSSSSSDTFAVPENPTSTRLKEKTNNEALQTLKRQLALSNGVEQAVDITFDSYEDAISARDSLLSSLDEELEKTDDDNLFIALSELRAKTVLLVPSEEESLPTIQTVKRAQTEPSLVVAYDLYESLDLEQDIVDRNHITHPGFVPGGEDLEVISRE